MDARAHLARRQRAARGRCGRGRRGAARRLSRPAQAVPLRPGGTSTTSVGAMADGTVDVARAARRRRCACARRGWTGRCTGLTMVGLGRLDDLQACVRVGGLRRHRGRPHRGRRVAGRSVDPHARDARRAGRRAHGVGGRLLRGLPRGGRPGRRLARPACVRLPRGARSKTCAPASRASGYEHGVRSCPASSRRRCPRWPSAAGRSSASTPTPTRRRDWRCAACTPASRSAAT